MSKIIMMKGLPGSGKTFYSKWLIDSNPGVYKRVNKDDLRAMLDNSVHTVSNEKFVLKLRDFIIAEALTEGKQVIVDDTNIHPKHERHLGLMAESMNVKFEIKEMDTPLDVCIQNDLKRPNSVGEKVIRKMYRDLQRNNGELLEDNTPKYVNDKNLPLALICDIDGTLALMKGRRGPFDWKKVGQDDLNEKVAAILDVYAAKGTHRIILLSGRDGSCMMETVKWLEEHDVPFNDLYMRPEGNCEKDSIIKEKLFNDNVKNFYHVDFVLDDRDQVVDMWRSLGLTCLQVARGDF